MPRLRVLLLALAALLPIGGRAANAQPATLSVSGNPGLLRISTAVAGSQPISVGNSTTTYTVDTGNPNRTYDITAQLNAAMPAGVTLTGTYAAPAGATSVGQIALDQTARNVVVGIPRRTTSTHGITYQLSATVLAGVVPLSTRTVTLTIVQAP
ncbi:MAG: hypothetical protein WD801_09400 [Gemmatimonadaceae bacterium]